MSLTRWNPFLEFKSIEDEMSRLFRRVRPWSGGSEQALAAAEFAPPVDVYEDENKLTYKLQVAGIDSKDLDIRVDGNELSVSGERKFEKEEHRENFRRIESEYGYFSRSFTLPASADTNKIGADVQNGILRIEVPKRAEAKGKQIQIQGRVGKPEEKEAA